MQQASEQDLWQLFSPAGDVLELAILRSQGRSKGCAFLTYATRQQVSCGMFGPDLSGCWPASAAHAHALRSILHPSCPACL